ncbi:MAG: cyclic nucleotide-binding domain-containing protein [Pseudomonadota bacterium]
MSVMNRKVYHDGTSVFKEGETASRAFLVESGQVEIRKEIDGKEVVLGTVDKGGIFGEMALIDNAPRMASAVAVGETVLVVITQTLFEDKLREADPFIRALLKIFVRNIRGAAQKAK